MAALARPVQVRAAQLLRDLPEPGSAARAGRVLDPLRLDPGARTCALARCSSSGTTCGASSGVASDSRSRRSGSGSVRVLGVAFTIFSLYWSVFFWQKIFGGLIAGAVERRARRPGAPDRARRCSSPVRSCAASSRSVRSLSRKVRGVVDAVRFRLQTRWRVEAAELIDALADVRRPARGRAVRSRRPGEPEARSRPASPSSDRGIDPTPSTSSGRDASRSSRRTWTPGRSGCSAPSAGAIVRRARADRRGAPGRDRSRGRRRAAVRGRRGHVRPAPVRHGPRAGVRADASAGRRASRAAALRRPRVRRARRGARARGVGERRPGDDRHRAG